MELFRLCADTLKSRWLIIIQSAFCSGKKKQARRNVRFLFESKYRWTIMVYVVMNQHWPNGALKRSVFSALMPSRVNYNCKLSAEIRAISRSFDSRFIWPTKFEWLIVVQFGRDICELYRKKKPMIVTILFTLNRVYVCETRNETARATVLLHRQVRTSPYMDTQ